ncbi:MAG: ATP-dependent zinc metalloprotease FtsH [Patescibacteria group bacterium]
MNSTTKNILIFVAALVVLGAALAFWNFNTNKQTDLSTIAREVQSGKITAINVQGTDVIATESDGTKIEASKEDTEGFTSEMKDYGVDTAKLQNVAITIKDESGPSYWVSIFAQDFLPFLLVFAVMWYFLRQVQGQNSRAMMFGQSGAREIQKDGKDKVTFADVAGVKEAKDELGEIVEFLKHPQKFIDLGAKIPKGVLLMGGPGTGKTLLARAVAGEAEVPFFAMSGSEFVEMFVGVGASRVRDLFAKAKKSAPCIIFIDEIDAVGRQRGSGLGGSHDEREQTLNQILVEMDGFEPNAGVIVMAATNRPDVLDPALLRPGRFDRRVTLDPPDLNDREQILGIHAKNKPLAKDVDLRKLAERTPGFSGADLQNLMNEGAILAARRNLKEITMDCLVQSIEKVMLGPERRSHIMNEDERKVTAYHEAGHALVAHLLPHADPVTKISIISRGRAAGYTLKMPLEDRTMRRREEYCEDIAVALGGYAAEQIFFGDITTGASSDMKSATRIARLMVTQWGMSEKLGPRTYGEQEDMIFLGREIHENRDYSDNKAVVIDAEIDALIAQGLATATKLISHHKDAMDRVGEKLLEKETLEREQFVEAIGLPPANPKNELKAQQT